jgi:hypothetical protein
VLWLQELELVSVSVRGRAGDSAVPWLALVSVSVASVRGRVGDSTVPRLQDLALVSVALMSVTGDSLDDSSDESDELSANSEDEVSGYDDVLVDPVDFLRTHKMK